jgi:argininosuccinate synthase
MVALERAPIYEATALAVINAHPELRKLIREREELEKKYVETRKKRFKGKWILFE